jgi:hypothetical protein
MKASNLLAMVSEARPTRQSLLYVKALASFHPIRSNARSLYVSWGIPKWVK